jgi:predicted ATPase
LSQGAKVYGFRGEPQRVLDFYVHVRQIVAEHKLPMHGAEEWIWCGWAQGQISPSTDAAALVQQGISNWQGIGANLNQCLLSALLAETCIKIGEMASARQAIETGLAIVATTGEDYYRPELYRLQGQCMLAVGDVDAAQVSFGHALELAQQQRVKSLELRAAMDLSRLLAAQGNQAQAYELLAGIYNWFTEGFDTADLRQAKESLLALSP